MKAMRDAAILLVLVLAVLSIRVTPAEGITGLVPRAEAAAAEPSDDAHTISPAIRSSSSFYSLDRDESTQPMVEPLPPPPSCESPSLQVLGNRDGQEVILRIQLKRDRSLEAVMESSPIDPDRPREAPAAGAAC